MEEDADVVGTGPGAERVGDLAGGLELVGDDGAGCRSAVAVKIAAWWSGQVANRGEAQGDLVDRGRPADLHAGGRRRLVEVVCGRAMSRNVGNDPAGTRRSPVTVTPPASDAPLPPSSPVARFFALPWSISIPASTLAPDFQDRRDVVVPSAAVVLPGWNGSVAYPRIGTQVVDAVPVGSGARRCRERRSAVRR